uniref:Uncharacterized protein n=1 Tax=Chrysotila carterae TaxID=13221 RepID=A0A7S4EXA5_CHRCT|mmetsp:Transcript_1621/g.3081  ORF Transcript_1621/g.3081 Transcript_1621/m.3081 type:complete len:101 (+) Transcript_1621:330-632(+)
MAQQAQTNDIAARVVLGVHVTSDHTFRQQVEYMHRQCGNPCRKCHFHDPIQHGSSFFAEPTQGSLHFAILFDDTVEVARLIPTLPQSTLSFTDQQFFLFR